MVRNFMLIVTALCCSASAVDAQGKADVPDYVIAEFGTPPEVPNGSLTAHVREALEDVLTIAGGQSDWDPGNTKALDAIANARDPRLVWLLTDIQRFSWRPEFHAALTRIAATILQTSFETSRHRAEIIDKMIAWDVPAYPGYLAHKRRLFTRYLSGVEKIFTDGTIDWRLVDWGGVNIDARPYGETDVICHCIPAIDNPPVMAAADTTWLADNDVIFGIVINGAARAYPRRIMEVREMVNDTLGGRDLAMPYCTLCGAAQAYFTDRLPTGVKRPILRTSGLLLRSNKVMYDIETHSVFDTFKGKAVTGPLAGIDLQLKRATVITSTWGAWRDAHPDTTVLIEALALGRDYKLRETRDADGPIFPIGDVDPRLPVHEDIIGVVTGNGTPIAFPHATAAAALNDGQEVVFEDIRLELSAGGIRAIGANGEDKGSHQAFWFAWSQFYPGTVVWGK